MKKKEFPVFEIFFIVVLVGVTLLAGLQLYRFYNILFPKFTLLIDDFESEEVLDNKEYAASNPDGINVELSYHSVHGFRSLKVTLDNPGISHHIASGRELKTIKASDWDAIDMDKINWNNVYGLSYWIYVKEYTIRGGEAEIEGRMIQIATDLIDGDDEYLRKVSLVHTGEWIKVTVYFGELLARDDFQIPGAKVNGTIDTLVKRYQIELLNMMNNRCVFYIDDVRLIILKENI